MKKLLMIALLIIIVSGCKEKKFRESHRFYWLKGETCGYVNENGDTVRVAMKYCTCCKH